MANQQSAAPVLHDRSEAWEQAAAFLRSKGLKAPTTASKFNAWLAENAAARSALLAEFPDAAVALGQEIETPPFIADLRANPPGEASVALGRKVLDQNLTEAQLRALLVDRPAVLKTILESIELWRESIVGPEARKALEERMAATAAANRAEQERALNAGPPIVRAVAESKAAQQRQLIKKVEALQASGKWHPPAA
jgi:hypothetical protein